MNLHRTNLVNKGFIIWHKEHPRTCLIHFRAAKRKPVICKKEGAFQYSRLLLPSRQINHRKIISTVTENFRAPAWTWRNVLAGTKRAMPSGQYRFVLPARVANHSAGFGSEARSDWQVKFRISFAIYLRATREKMASRFASVTGEEITQINDEAVPENTKKRLVWFCCV